MPHDVFISYATANRNVADAACHYLEAAGIRVWMAPRDIQPGEEWSAAIVDGIHGARVVVLVFSSHANDSHQVKREIEIAVGRGLAIIPFRIEDILPSKAMEYFIGPHHWLDAMTPPLERHVRVLTDKVRLLLDKEAGDAEATPGPPGGAPRDPALVEATSLAARWAGAGHPYYLVESLSPELKAFVVNPPFGAAAEDPEVDAFLLVASLHYGSSWPFWVRRNAGNLQAVRHVINVLGLAYDRPRMRAVCALLFFRDGLVEQAAADLGGALDPRIRKLLEQVVMPGRAREYLQRQADGKDLELAKKATAVLKELLAASGPADDDLRP